MTLDRRLFLATGLCALTRPAFARDPGREALAREVLVTWHRLVLELVRHTATYSPPVAARAFGYLGVVAHETLAAMDPALRSLGGQLNGLARPHVSEPQADKALALHSALSDAAGVLFGNTGPMGQRAHGTMTARLGADLATELDHETRTRSAALGQRITAHVLDWAAGDGGAEVANMGFALDYTAGPRPEDWQPTSLIRQQQAPLLPDWGRVRPFAMPADAICGVALPPAYDTQPGSEFHSAALEVHEVTARLTEEQKLIARFWADPPMLSPTPPGHWIAILLDIADRDDLPVEPLAAALARLGAAQADAFIACWDAKYRYNLLRPVTYIRHHIDPDWTPLIETPPFPEYPSGHSTQSSASATALSAIFGEDFAFEDRTHLGDGLPARHFPSFRAASEEAAMSRLYGGIHYRFGNEAGLAQGRCVGAYAAALEMRA